MVRMWTAETQERFPKTYLSWTGFDYAPNNSALRSEFLIPVFVIYMDHDVMPNVLINRTKRKTWIWFIYYSQMCILTAGLILNNPSH